MVKYKTSPKFDIEKYQGSKSEKMKSINYLG